MLAKEEMVYELYPEMVLNHHLNTKKTITYLKKAAREVYEIIHTSAFPFVLLDKAEIGWTSPVIAWCLEDTLYGVLVFIVIDVNSTSDIKTLHETVKHELVHANQIKEGRLKYTPDSEIVIWEGRSVSLVPLETSWEDGGLDIYCAKVRSQPWELEADTGLTMYEPDYYYLRNKYGKPFPDFCVNKETYLINYMKNWGCSYAKAVDILYSHCY